MRPVGVRRPVASCAPAAPVVRTAFRRRRVPVRPEQAPLRTLRQPRFHPPRCAKLMETLPVGVICRRTGLASLRPATEHEFGPGAPRPCLAAHRNSGSGDSLENSLRAGNVYFFRPCACGHRWSRPSVSMHKPIAIGLLRQDWKPGGRSDPARLVQPPGIARRRREQRSSAPMRRLPIVPYGALARHSPLDMIELTRKGETAMPTSGSSRRAFIKAMGVVAATCGRAADVDAQDYKPQDQKKLTQAAARYQDHPKENESCGNCPYFVFPKSCVVVEGEVSAFGWCPMYTRFSPLDRGGHASGMPGP